MTRKLDRSRPFASVHGISDVRYEQDGLPFDYSENLMVPAAEQDHQEAPKKRGRPKKVVDEVVEITEGN